MNPDNLFESVFRAIPLPVLLLDARSPDFKILTASAAFCKLACTEPQHLLGKPLWAAFSTDSNALETNGAAMLRHNILRALETGMPQELRGQQYEINNPASECSELRYWHTVSTPIRTSEHGDFIYVLNTATDVTHEFQLQTRNEEAEKDRNHWISQLASVQQQNSAVSESNSLLHTIIDAAQTGIALLAPVMEGSKVSDFRFRMTNTMLADYIGKTPRDLQGSTVSQWLPSYRGNGLFEKLARTCTTGEAERFEFHYDADGLCIWMDVLATWVNGEVLVTFTDHTAMKNLQRRLEDHVSELRSSNADLEQFAYVASHDLQEPLRKVKSFGDMLESRYHDKLGPEGADLIGRMQSAAGRMGTLINDLLTYSRASVKPKELTTIDTNKVLDGVILDLERAIQQQKATIRKDKLFPVAGQATQIGQIFLNLISNALKFHKPGEPPEIVISSSLVKGKDSGVIIARTDMEKMYQRIEVRDNGIGFDNTYRDLIFQIFQRLNNRSDYPGSGVGLSIVKKVIENHDGYIRADSEPNAGTTFTILLPFAEREA